MPPTFATLEGTDSTKEEKTGELIGVAEENIRMGDYVSVDNITRKLRRTIATDQ